MTEGAKHWILFRQNEAFFGAMSGLQFKNMKDKSQLPEGFHCTQEAGDIMYVPHGWGHTLINSGQMTVGVAIQFNESKS